MTKIILNKKDFATLLNLQQHLLPIFTILNLFSTMATLPQNKMYLIVDTFKFFEFTFENPHFLGLHFVDLHLGIVGRVCARPLSRLEQIRLRGKLLHVY